jgi:hypothetical protein
MVYWAPILHFSEGCRASHLQVLKTAAKDLLAEVERLERAL